MKVIFLLSESATRKEIKAKYIGKFLFFFFFLNVSENKLKGK